MSAHGVTLAQLRALTAVVEAGRFVRAAELLHTSPPALTQQIARLERTAGAVLLDRSRQPIAPTPAGEILLAAARNALRTIEGALSRLSGTAGETLRIGFLNTPSSPRARAVLDDLREASPPLTVVMQQLDWHRQTRAVRDGTVDAALIRPPVAADPDLVFELVEEEPRVAIVGSRHRLARRRAVDLAELDGESVVHGGAGLREWSRWWAIDPRPTGVAVVYGDAVQTMEEALETVRRTDQVLITARSVVDAFRHSDLRMLRLRDGPPCSLVLCSRADDRSTGVRVLRDLVSAAPPSPGAPGTVRRTGSGR